MKNIIIGIIGVILLLLIAISFFNKDSYEETTLSFSADAYYVTNNIVGNPDFVYIENADEINKTLSGKYSIIKKVEDIEEYKDNYEFAISPVYKNKDPKDIDKYSKNATPEYDDEGNLILYGEVIYLFPKGVIAIFDSETQTYQIEKSDIDNKYFEGLFK